METIIIPPASRGKMEALKAFLTALKMDFKVVEQKEAAQITNPETIRRIEAYEQGVAKTEAHSLEEIKAMLRA